MPRPTAETLRLNHRYRSAVGRCAIIPAMPQGLRVEPGSRITLEFAASPDEPVSASEVLTVRACARGRLDDIMREHAWRHFLRTPEWGFGREHDIGGWVEHLRKVIASTWGDPAESDEFYAVYFN